MEKSKEINNEGSREMVNPKVKMIDVKNATLNFLNLFSNMISRKLGIKNEIKNRANTHFIVAGIKETKTINRTIAPVKLGIIFLLNIKIDATLF